MQRLALMGAPPPLVQDVLLALARPAVDVLANLSPAAAAVISAAHANNWLTVQGTDLAVCYQVGSMPGDPWGDIIFELLQARFAKAVRERLLEEGLLPTVKCKGLSIVPSSTLPCHERTIPEVSFVDDVAAPLMAPTPQSLVQGLTRM
eukprot:8082011-Alexandrium_andersonii.AAC.1